MRELIYKAWIIKNKVMENVNCIDLENNKVKTKSGWFDIGKDVEVLECEYVKTRNNNKTLVCEGDVYRSITKNNSGRIISNNLWLVKWDNSNNKLIKVANILKTYYGETGLIPHEANINSINDYGSEHIGNIYEDSELLKEWRNENVL